MLRFERYVSFRYSWAVVPLFVYACKEFVVASIHMWKDDGGAGSIAGYPFGESGCDDEILFAFNFLATINYINAFHLMCIVAFAPQLAPLGALGLLFQVVLSIASNAFRDNLSGRLFPDAPGQFEVFLKVGVILLTFALCVFEQKKAKLNQIEDNR